MKTLKTLLVVTGLFITANAMAECPVELPTEKLLDCIVVEGAGSEYPTEQVLAQSRAEKAESQITALESK
jgi:hypothetical protein